MIMGVVPKPDIISQLLPGHAGRGRGGRKPQIIVIHTQAGAGNPFSWFQSLGVNGASAADCTIWNPAAASGKLVRYLYDSDTAWTNGDWTEPINHKNPVLEGLFKSGVYSGDVSLTVENEGNRTFTDAQYTRLAQLVAWWSDQYTIPIDRNHIVGHSEIGPHKQCPGPFDFDRLIANANQLYNAAYGRIPPPPFDPNPQHFTVGSGMLAKLTELQLQAATNEMYFNPGPNQPGLGKMSQLWTSIPGLKLEAYEELDASDKPTGNWDVKALKEL
jgi:hypothetical protein